MSREPIRLRRNFQTEKMPPQLLWDIRRRFHRLSPKDGHVAHALRTLPPVAAKVLLLRAAPRLACVKPAASVHPEPGSNSSLYILFFQACPGALNFLKKSTLSNFFCSRYLLYFLSVLSMIVVKKSRSSRERDCKGNPTFLISKLYFTFFHCFF